MKKVIATIIALTVVVAGAHGQFDKTINVTSADAFAGQSSQGTAFGTGGLTFEAGVYTDGTPTIETFSGGWRILPTSGVPASGSYIDFGGGQGGYDFTFALNSNDAPFTPGTQAYVWGFSERDLGAGVEWILFTNSAWTVPALPTSPDATPLTWALTDAGTVAVDGFGNLDVAGRAFTSVEAIPEPSTYALIFGLGILGFLGFRRFRK